MKALAPLSFSPRLIGDGSAPGAGGETGLLRQRSPFRESILSLHTSLLLSGGDRMRVLAVSSSLPGEGKSTVSSNLATAFAGLGGPTVLVDADMRRPNIHRLFHVSNRLGLSTVLRGQATLAEALADSGIKNLTLLPSGPVSATPSELLHLGLGEVIEQLRQRFEYVLVDCPPVLGFADSFAVAGAADALVLVVLAGQTERQHVSAAVRQLHGVRANVLAVVLNQVNESLDSAYSYYGAYYAKYYSDGAAT
jgi:capsular exopolysaccharide synthesis family protein